MDWFKIGKEYNKVVYCHSVYLTYMQSTSCEIWGWMNHKLEFRPLGVISKTLAESEEELKSLLMTVKEESEKLAENSIFKKNLRSWHPIPSFHGI